jgi:hypothetical protein
VRASDARPSAAIHAHADSGFGQDFATLLVWWQAGFAFNLAAMNARARAIVARPLAVGIAIGVAGIGCASSSPPASGRGPLSAASGEGAASQGGNGLSLREAEHALASEKVEVAILDRQIAEAEGEVSTSEDALLRAVALRADRVARASFVAALQHCLDHGTGCPPSLAEPKPPDDWDAGRGEWTGSFTAVAARWPEESARIERDACGCRTAGCAAWMLADLARWEAALPREVEGGEQASVHVTAARACLWQRTGRRAPGTP